MNIFSVIKVSRLLTFLFLALWSLPAFSSPTFGRYIGVLKHENIAQDQLARLDFVTEQESGGILKLRATLVLFFGGFDSTEYASYDYDNVTYNLLNGTLVFDSSERELHFVVEHFKAGSLTADLKTGSGIVGKLMLTQDDTVRPERPLVQPLWGEYRGLCQGVGERFQIQSSPSHPMTTNRTDPFAPFVIQAQRGENGVYACPVGTSTCITNIYSDADYAFFNGHIDFHGNYGALTCSVDKDGLTCGDCRFTRSSKERVMADVYSVPASAPSWKINADDIGPNASLAGVYKGFIHLEGRDIYQPFSVGVTTYRQNDGSSSSGESLMVSVVASLIFGDHTGNDESINTKFDPRPLNIMNAQPIFDRADHSTDMVLKITKLSNGIMEGIWFSRRYGRVGTFALSSTGHIDLLQPEKLDSKISGHFNDGLWNMTM